MAELVTYQLEKSVATITLDDGKANALSPVMLTAINAALDRALADKAVVIVTGRSGIFSGGFDLKVMGRGGDEAYGMLMAGFRLAERMLAFPRPIIVACNGHALAMGVFVLLAADYRIGVDGAYKIGANEVAIGMTMPRSAIEVCRQRLTPAHFNRAMNQAEIWKPADAVGAGFLDEAVPEEELMPAAHRAAARMLALNLPAHTATKLRVREGTLKALRAAIDADDAEARVGFRVGVAA
jgi:enoyl-CoA hydratase